MFKRCSFNKTDVHHIRKVFITLCPTGWQNFFTKGAGPRKQRPPEGGVVLGVVGAVGRTVLRTIGSGTVVVVEHPGKGRQRQPKNAPSTDSAVPPSSIWRNHSQKIHGQIFGL